MQVTERADASITTSITYTRRLRGDALAADVAAKAEARPEVIAIHIRQPTRLARIVRPMQDTAARTSLSPRLRRKLDIDTQQKRQKGAVIQQAPWHNRQVSRSWYW